MYVGIIKLYVKSIFWNLYVEVFLYIFLSLFFGRLVQKRPRIVWKQDYVDKTFLDACIHEITSNGREGTSLKANSWKVVA